MSLLNDYYEPFNIIDKATDNDTYGALITVWRMGAEFIGIAEPQSSTEAQIAMAISEKKVYGIVTKKDVVLRHNDVIRRQSDGKIFRITSDADDKKTPNSATLNMRRCDAVEITLPSEIVGA